MNNRQKAFLRSDPWPVYGYVDNNPINYIDPLGLLLRDPEIAAIIFNETRSLSGDPTQLSIMYQNLAHAIMNADALEDSTKGRFKRPKSAPTVCTPGKEQNKYDRILKDVQTARNVREGEGEDPTGGALQFNLRGNNSRGNLFNGPELPISTQNGPFNNSYTKGGLPASGVYVNTYFNTLWSRP